MHGHGEFKALCGRWDLWLLIFGVGVGCLSWVWVAKFRIHAVGSVSLK